MSSLPGHGAPEDGGSSVESAGPLQVNGGWRKRIPGLRLLTRLLPEAAPLDLRIVGRTVLHAALVGAAAGLIGAAFFAGLELLQHFLLEDLAGYVVLRATGEQVIRTGAFHPFRPWLLLVLPALGALGGGLVSRFAPETVGGGGDAMIRAFHQQAAVVRARVIWVKAVASLLTLGGGGAGGREGPTMQIGGALGSLLARLLRVSERERRVLFVAGVAAGMSAVFRTPLGAALLAIEVLYTDDFEAEALVPAILASVVAYAVVISIYGESTLFARAPHYPFIPGHLWLYGLLALIVAAAAATFASTLEAVHRLAAKLPGPAWARPAAGGLALGILAIPAVLITGSHIGHPGQGLGILGGGYGAAQMAITGSEWLRGGWQDVELLLLLCGVKLVASSLTIGSGGSAGDFAPSLVLGGLLGGAFGRAASLLLHDPRIDPGAFALVGMGTFYGGIAHVPVSSLIIVSELAGSYDLLVPLMLAEGIALVALRRRSLYHAQLSTRQIPSPRLGAEQDVLQGLSAADLPLLSAGAGVSLNTRTDELVSRTAAEPGLDLLAVTDEAGRFLGVVRAETIRGLGNEGGIDQWTVAADLMDVVPTVAPGSSLRAVADLMIANRLRTLPVVGEDGKLEGFLDEASLFAAYLAATGAGRTAV